MAPRLDTFCHLLSRPNAIEVFNHRVSHLKSLRRVDEGTPRIENQVIRNFSSWRQKSTNTKLKEFQKGDGAVLVPLIEMNENREPHVLFTHRSYRLRKHRGEISFPGGQIDEGETIEQVNLYVRNKYFLRLERFLKIDNKNDLLYLTIL